MIKKVFIVLVAFALASCSVQRKLDRNLTGMGREVLLSQLGEPMRIVDLEEGSQMFIYVKETYVRATEIGQGKASLDPRISPGFVKEETFKFLIDADGIIQKSFYEKEQK